MATLTASQVHAATQSCAPAQQKSASKPKRNIMDLPLVERAILIIKNLRRYTICVIFLIADMVTEYGRARNCRDIEP